MCPRCFGCSLGSLPGSLHPSLQAIAELGWAKPTLIQEKAIPLALEGKDLLARARTGSGKTAAYAIPLIQHLLQVKMVRLPLGGRAPFSGLSPSQGPASPTLHWLLILLGTPLAWAVGP